MLPIWDMRQTFLTTPLSAANVTCRSQQGPQCSVAIVILAFRGKHRLCPISPNMRQTYATITAHLSDESQFFRIVGHMGTRCEQRSIAPAPLSLLTLVSLDILHQSTCLSLLGL